MSRINLFGAFIYIAHKISFCNSPINSQRFELEFKQRLAESKSVSAFQNNDERNEEQDEEQLSNFDQTSANQDLYWYSKLWHPFEVAKSIKNYHMVSYKFFIIFIGHFLLLFHFTIKCFVHTFYTGSDQAKIDFFNSLYYPHLASMLPEPYLLNNLFLVMCIYSLIARLLCAYHLIKYSIINADKYEKLLIGQVNMAVLPICEFTVQEWYQLFKHSREHESKIERFSSARIAHLNLSSDLLKNLDNLSQKDLLFYINVIDFNECFEEIGLFDLNRRLPKYQSWHIAQPIVRISTGIVKNALILFVLSMIFLAFFSFVTLMVVIYLELRSAFPSEHQVDILEVLFIWRKHLSDPLHLLRLIEFILLVLLQIPQLVDAGSALMNQLIFISRIRKIISILEDELYNCSIQEDSRCRFNNEFTSYDYQILHERPFEDLMIHDKYLDDRKRLSKKARELNHKLQQSVKLIRLLHFEFMSIKKDHTSLFNLIVVGNGFNMAYIISLMITTNGWPQYMLLGIVMFASLAPTINTLLFSACVERYLRLLYTVMCRFLINKQNLLEPKTIKMLRTRSEAFEKLEDRSISILGLYAITLDSVAPVS